MFRKVLMILCFLFLLPAQAQSGADKFYSCNYSSDQKMIYFGDDRKFNLLLVPQIDDKVDIEILIPFDSKYTLTTSSEKTDFLIIIDIIASKKGRKDVKTTLEINRYTLDFVWHQNGKKLTNGFCSLIYKNL